MPPTTSLPYYKLTYKKCLLEEDSTEDRLKFTQATAQSTIKIRRLRNAPRANVKDQPGILYLKLSSLSSVLVTGDLLKLSTDVPIKCLTVTGALRSLTARGPISEIVTGSARSVKINAQRDAISDTPQYASSTILSTSNSFTAVKVHLTGVILEAIDADQPVACIKVSRKKYKDTISNRNKKLR